MRKSLLNPRILIGLMCLQICLTQNNFAQQLMLTDTFNYTGSTQTFVIPSCASAITVQVFGAEGGYGSGGNAWAHGYGGYVEGVLTPTLNALLYLNVGGAATGSVGGYNGGGNGGQGSLTYGGGGGGASDVRIGGNTLTNRIIVAGGGGGGGTSPSAFGGSGGNFMYGACGTNGIGGEGGWGVNMGSGGACAAGSATMSGAGGAGAGVTAAPGVSGSGAGSYGQGGSLGQGGNGGGMVATYGGSGAGINGGGGGGGGVYGGAGGMSQDYTGTSPFSTGGGGGGGSSFADINYFSTILFNGTGAYTQGFIVLKYFYSTPVPVISVSPSSPTVCSGASISLGASGVMTYTWLAAGSFSGSNTSNIVVSPLSSTQYTVSGTNTSGCVSQTVVAVTVSTLTTFTNSLSLCTGNSTLLTANGSLSYTWLPVGSFAGSNFASVMVSPSVTTNYSVIGTNLSGCNSQTVFAVTVGNSQGLTINNSTNGAKICKGETVILTVTNPGSFVWTNSANSATYTTPSIIVNPTVTTVYSVSGTSSSNCNGNGSAQVSVLDCTSLTQINEADLETFIYPNPNTGVFVISCGHDLRIGIHDQLGKEVKLLELNEQNGRSITVNDLSNGVYFITMKDDQSCVTKKVIVAER